MGEVMRARGGIEKLVQLLGCEDYSTLQSALLIIANLATPGVDSNAEVSQLRGQPLHIREHRSLFVMHVTFYHARDLRSCT